MPYTNFAYYFRPHGYINHYSPFKFIMRQYSARMFRCSDAVNKYLNRRVVMEMRAWPDEINRLHRASRHRPRRTVSSPAMSINHLRYGDTFYCNDELAASCGL